MRHWVKGLLLTSTIYVSPVQAIVNFENMDLVSDQSRLGFEAHVGLDIVGKNGNTSTRKTGFDSRLQWFKPQNTEFLVFNYEYGETSDIKVTDKSLVHLRHINYRTDSLSWEAFGQLQNNEFTRLSLRSLVGGGLRFKLGINSDSHSSYLGTGLFRSKETLEQDASATDEGTEYATRANLYLVNKVKLSETASLSNTLFYQPDLDGASDYRLLEQFRFKVKITEQLAIILSLDVSHDSQPPQNIERSDSSYTTGFSYRF